MVVLIYISLMTSDVENIFMYLLDTHISSLGNMSILVIGPFLVGLFGIFAIDLYEFFLYFGYLSSIRYMV